jgi:Transposase, Mutator family
MFEAEVCGGRAEGQARPGSGRGATRHRARFGDLGGRRVPVTRPQASSTDGPELPLASYQRFAADDLLPQVVLERMLAGVATRRHTRTAEPIGEQIAAASKSTSRSAISRRFVRQTETALAELMARDLTGLEIKVLMLDGEHLAGRWVVVALAITADGTKLPVEPWDGSTENTTVVDRRRHAQSRAILPPQSRATSRCRSSSPRSTDTPIPTLPRTPKMSVLPPRVHRESSPKFHATWDMLAGCAPAVVSFMPQHRTDGCFL